MSQKPTGRKVKLRFPSLPVRCWPLALIFLLVALAPAGAKERPLTPEERAGFLDAFSRLGSDSYREREAAYDEIDALGPPVLGMLLERKGNPDPHVRETVRRLIKAIRREIVRRRTRKMFRDAGLDETLHDPAELLELYTSPGEDDRLEALTRLTSRRTPACVPIVKEFLADPSDKVVDSAIASLRHLHKGKDADIAARILRIVRRTRPEDSRVNERIRAFLRFADFRDESLVSAFLTAGTAPEEKVRELALARMVLEPQENHVFAFGSMLGASNRVLRRFCAGGIEVVVHKLLVPGRREMFSFDELERKRLSTLLARGLESSDPLVVQVAAGAIGRCGVVGAVDRLARLLRNKNAVTARRAAVSLGLMKSTRAVPALVSILKSGNYELLPEASDALGRIGDPASFEPLLALLKKKDVPFRELLLAAVTRVDLKRSVDVLISLLSDEKVAVRALAVDRLVKALKKFGKLRASKLETLLVLIREGAVRAKVAGARVLGEAGDATVLPALRRLAGSRDPEIRSASMLPIAMIALSQARPTLLANVKHADYRVRVRAAEALGYLGDWSELLKVRRVTVETKGATVVETLKKIAASARMNMVIDPGAVRMSSLDTTVVEASLAGKSVEEALESLGERFNITYQAADYAVFVTVRPRKGVLEKFKPAGAGLGCTEADLEVEKKLSMRVVCSSAREGMETFFDNLGRDTGVPFKLDESIERRLTGSLRFVDVTVSDIPLSSLLRLVLAPRGLSFRITGGAVVITAGK